MTTLMHEPSTATPARGGAFRVFTPEFWGAVAIAAMWLAVLFDGIFGDQMTFTSSPFNVTSIPSAVLVALFAVIGTSAVAKRAFGRKGPDGGP
jgi:hypothetical protein